MYLDIDFNVTIGHNNMGLNMICDHGFGSGYDNRDKKGNGTGNTSCFGNGYAEGNGNAGRLPWYGNTDGTGEINSFTTYSCVRLICT